MSKAMPPRPLPRLRELPRERAGTGVLGRIIAGPLVERQPGRFELPVGELLEQLGGDPGISFIPARCWRQAGQAAQVGALSPELPADQAASRALELSLFAAAIAGRPLAQVFFWLQTLEQPETLKEIVALAGHYWRFSEPKTFAEQLAASAPAELRAQAQAAISALRFLSLQIGQPDFAGADNGDRSEAGTPAPTSRWQRLEDIYAFGLIFRALAWPLRRGRSRVSFAVENGSWRSLAVDGQAPAKPLEGYRLLVPEKHVDGNTISFGCAGYRYRGGWQRIRNIRLAELDTLPARFDSQTPIEQLSDAWADYAQVIAQLNERRYQNMRAAGEHSEQQQQAELQESDAQREQLRRSAETAELLPGGRTFVGHAAREQVR